MLSSILLFNGVCYNRGYLVYVGTYHSLMMLKLKGTVKGTVAYGNMCRVNLHGIMGRAELDDVKEQDSTYVSVAVKSAVQM
jgi:hypothetical protein